MRFRKQFATLTLVLVPHLYAARFDDKVRGDFFAGFKGDQAALERAMKTSEEAIAADPAGSAEAMAWHGGGLMVMSGQAFQQGDYTRGGELWEQAVNEMDKAGTLAPDSPAVLIPRAAVWFAASRRAPPDRGMPLLEKAIADYERVYAIQKTYFDTLDIHMRSELLFGLADGYNRDGNPAKAREYFEKLSGLGPASGHFEQATQFLNGGKYEVRGIGCAGCHAGKVN